MPLLPRMSNHNDFDPLRLHPGVELRFAETGRPWPAADLVILPGSKATRADLAFLREQGWDREIERHLRFGGKVLGICGGFQMLGERIEDPDGLEGDPGGDDGLGWLALRTTLVRGKQLRNVSGTLLPDGVPIHGYEIHNGVSDGAALGRPLLHLDGRADGALSDDDRLRGTYLHGLFDDPGATDALLRWAGLADSAAAIDYHHHRQHDLDRLANAIDQHLDTGALLALLNPM